MSSSPNPSSVLTLEEARYHIFQKYSPDSTLSPKDHFFKLKYTEIAEPQRILFPAYCSELRAYEAEIKAYEAETKVEMKAKEIEGLLSLYFGPIEVKFISQIIPINFLFEVPTPSLEASIVDQIISLYQFNGIPAPNDLVKRFSNIRASFTNDQNHSEEDLLKSRLSSSKKVLVSEHGGKSQFCPFKFLWIRDCYEPLYQNILPVAKTHCVAVIGDLGIGKSSFLRYLFETESENIKTNPGNAHFFKIFWMMESGHWRFFNGSTSSIGSGDSKLWEPSDVLLLLDGSYKDKFLSKIRGSILFCSPERSNYYKMIKLTQGRVFTMPTWTLEETLRMLNADVKEIDGSQRNIGIESFSELLDELSQSSEQKDKDFIPSDLVIESFTNFEEEEEEEDYDDELIAAAKLASLEDSRQQESDFGSGVGSLMSIAGPSAPSSTRRTSPRRKRLEETAGSSIVANVGSSVIASVEELYDESESFSKFGPSGLKQFLEDLVTRRFRIVGGRIRLLLDNGIKVRDLQIRVGNSVACVSGKKLSSVGTLDYHSDIPSIIYSLVPESEENFRGYTISFASDYIREKVMLKIVKSYEGNFGMLFAAMKNYRIEGSLIGQIFESAVHDFFIGKGRIRLTCRRVEEKEQPHITEILPQSKKLKLDLLDSDFTFSPERCVIYDANDLDLKNFFSGQLATSSAYLRPKQSNAAQIDGIGYCGISRRFYFYQMTISKNHPIILKHIKSVCRLLGIVLAQVNFVFIVPDGIYDTFPRQKILVSDGVSATDQNSLNGQFVAKIENLDDLSRFYGDRFK